MLIKPPKVLIVDDFYPDPWLLRQEAEKISYTTKGRYLGQSGDVPWTKEINPWVRARLAELVGTHPYAIELEAGSGAFRLALKGERPQLYCHTDNIPAGWPLDSGFNRIHFSAVIYLTAPDYCQSTLDFFTNRETKADHLRSACEAKDILENKKFEKADLFEPWLRVPLRFNRLVLFQASLYHGPAFEDEGHGDDFENGRLVQAFWFSLKD